MNPSTTSPASAAVPPPHATLCRVGGVFRDVKLLRLPSAVIAKLERAGFTSAADIAATPTIDIMNGVCVCGVMAEAVIVARE